MSSLMSLLPSALTLAAPLESNPGEPKLAVPLTDVMSIVLVAVGNVTVVAVDVVVVAVVDWQIEPEEASVAFTMQRFV